MRQGILSINRYYDLEVQKVVAQYKLKSEEMNLYYQNLEKQRKEQERRFDKMIKIATIERKRANKAIKEAEQVCDFFRQKYIVIQRLMKKESIIWNCLNSESVELVQ